jgi:hypothetical protein
MTLPLLFFLIVFPASVRMLLSTTDEFYEDLDSAVMLHDTELSFE